MASGQRAATPQLPDALISWVPAAWCAFAMVCTDVGQNSRINKYTFTVGLCTSTVVYSFLKKFAPCNDAQMQGGRAAPR
jgi:hypothetical protein